MSFFLKTNQNAGIIVFCIDKSSNRSYDFLLGYSSLPALKNYNENVTKEDGHIKRIIAFGDSLTEGFLNGGRKFYPYSTKLEEKLNSYFNWTRFEVLNEGISGECVFTEMVTRLPKVLDRIGDRADLVIILGGTNDFNKLDCVKRVNVAHEIITLHRIVHKRGLRSVLVTIPECSMLSKKCDDNREKVNEKLRSYAAKNKKNTLLCDLGKFMPLKNMSDFDRKIYWDDKVHPSKIGYDKIAALLFHTVRQWLMPPVVNITVPPSKNDTKDKKVPDPDPVNKLKGQKKISHKKKENRDKKLAQALVSDINPKVANTNSSNYEATPGAAGSGTQFSPSNTQAITALPSVSSSGSPPSKAAELALEVTDPQKSANEKVTASSKLTKTHSKHKSKKLLHDAQNKKMNKSVEANSLKNSPNRLSSTNAFSPKASSSNNPSQSKLETPAKKPVTPSAPTNADTLNALHALVAQSYNNQLNANANTSNQYTQESTNDTNAPNNTAQQNITPPQQLQQQQPNAAANQAQTYNNENNNANVNNANVNDPYANNNNNSGTPSNSNVNIENENNNNSSDPNNQYLNNNNNTNNNNNNMAANNQDLTMANQQQDLASSMLPIDKGANQPSTPVAPPPAAGASDTQISSNVKSANQPEPNAENNQESTGTQGDIGDLQRNFPEFNLHERRHTG